MEELAQVTPSHPNVTIFFLNPFLIFTMNLVLLIGLLCIVARPDLGTHYDPQIWVQPLSTEKH